ncbi:MAG: hypothetical protein ABFC80_01060 [Coriobacteriales bacterium]|nr:hypothetical protein [Actinomycetes bacterium]
MTDIQTPNGIEFSAAAKCYLCGGRLIAPGGGLYFGVRTPQGTKVDCRSWCKGLMLVTIEWLDSNGYVQLWPADKKMGLSHVKSLGVRALYSDAPGFSGDFLRATQWQDVYLVDIFNRLAPYGDAPMVGLLDKVAEEFDRAGIYTKGGYGGHGDVWNTEWLTYLEEAWYAEAYDIWQRAWARPDQEPILQSLMYAVAANVEQERDHDRFDF